MIRLFIFPPLMAGTPNPGPFCVKLETALRLAGVQYETCHVTRPDQGPKGKIPYVEIEGERIGDSTLILERLKETRGIDLDAHLSPRERAQSHALQRMLEERLYTILVYSRWIEPTNWEKIRKLFFGNMPLPLRLIVPRKAHKGTVEKLHSQGIGRHKRDEIYAFGAKDLDALSEVLGDKPFVFGDKPSLADATAFAFVVSIIGPDMDSPLKAHAMSLPNLVAYAERMGEIFANSQRKIALAA